MGTNYIFENVIYQSAAAYNSAVLGASWPDAPTEYQTESLADLADLPPPAEVASPFLTSSGGGSRTCSDWLVNGICDRCSGTYRLSELSYQVFNRELLSIRVCDSCYDIDNPQLYISEVDVDDASVPADPRSDSADRIRGRGVCGWNPVVMNMPLGLLLSTAQVFVTNGASS